MTGLEEILLALAAAGLLVTAAYAYRVERRARRWAARRDGLLAERRGRADGAYGDELARARAVMRPSLPDTPMLRLGPWPDVHSRRVRP